MQNADSKFTAIVDSHHEKPWSQPIYVSHTFMIRSLLSEFLLQ